MLLILAGLAAPLVAQQHSASRVYLGFDRNEYPGDDLLAGLHRTFAFTGYWLNTPPGAAANSWTGKRAMLRARGFGFVLLFNGRLYADLKNHDTAALGRSDAMTAIAAARHEGFPARAIIFLDQEEGGGLLPEQAAYLTAWIETVRRSSYRPGVYCSGIPVPAGPGKTISTAADISARDSRVALWVANDQCPPSPGCVVPKSLPAATASGVPTAAIWQYTQSPRRPQFTAQCAATYAADGQCYPPNTAPSPHSFVDLNVASSPDPSGGR